LLVLALVDRACRLPTLDAPQILFDRLSFGPDGFLIA
jgi:hypothetical protein